MIIVHLYVFLLQATNQVRQVDQKPMKYGCHFKLALDPGHIPPFETISLRAHLNDKCGVDFPIQTPKQIQVR